MASKTSKSFFEPVSFSKPDFKAMTKVPREFWLAGLGTLSMARQKGEELFDDGSRYFNKLIAEGEKFEKRSRKRVEKRAEDVRERFTDLANGIRLPRALNKALGLADTVVFHLVPEDEQWAVRREGEDEDVSAHRTKKAALDAARDLAYASEPSRIVVHRADGTIQTSYGYGDSA
jgi:poly(hydroxyalkanoate) granule-associated protein